jgi:hypothetical protein
MRILSNGNVRRSASEWREIVRQFHVSDLSAKVFCDRESLGLASLRRWQSKIEMESADGVAGKFVEVGATEPEGFPAFWSLEIELPDGRTIRVRG